ncbi:MULTISPECIES: HigA family addiction module antitoxin [Pantoea]|jgi:addiction module HigA family antidote|uniref:HigA family addiction module antitoxin n=3 Tax=Pantoea TaxID=53335 RepID=A0AAU7TV51_9GAMM|nr:MULTISPECIES: HigA family addiction module antitoxin [Pantoea]MBD9646693.1 HigA family addiction module antidote protein [Pantoea sp. PNT02]MBD9661993.1 HigA family addiction module antidote protein [Pantoea sp. PNT03]MBY4954158.1 HigA family addiction module antidote protein [Pantoea sp. DY-17]MDR6348648.1 addiction module HigA family antidote [Pantoea sp. SORGH_AS_0659]PLR23617.1 addiction module antidote protein, HigA family [Pantoea endophytica]
MKQAMRKPTSVGDVLQYEFLEPLNLKVNDLAEMLNVHRNTVSALVNNNRKLTTEMAYRLAAVFDTSVDFWLNLQRHLDLWEVENDARTQEELSRVTPLSAFLAQRSAVVA